MRILITFTPRMYGEVLALTIHRRRPDFEVLLAPPGSSDGEIERFGPHVLVQGTDEAEPTSTALPDGVLRRIRILNANRADATIEVDGTISDVRDDLFEDLFEALERAEGLSKGNGPSRAADRRPEEMSDKALRMLQHMRKQVFGQPAPYVQVRGAAVSIGMIPGGPECGALVDELLRAGFIRHYRSPSLTAHGLYRLTDSGKSAAEEAALAESRSKMRLTDERKR